MATSTLTASQKIRTRRLRDLRRKLRLSESEFAKVVGVDFVLLRRFESGKEPWSVVAIATAHSALEDGVDAAQRDVEEAAAIVAELLEDIHS